MNIKTALATSLVMCFTLCSCGKHNEKNNVSRDRMAEMITLADMAALSKTPLSDENLKELKNRIASDRKRLNYDSGTKEVWLVAIDTIQKTRSEKAEIGSDESLLLAHDVELAVGSVCTDSHSYYLRRFQECRTEVDEIAPQLVEVLVGELSKMTMKALAANDVSPERKDWYQKRFETSYERYRNLADRIGAEQKANPAIVATITP